MNATTPRHKTVLLFNINHDVYYSSVHTKSRHTVKILNSFSSLIVSHLPPFFCVDDFYDALLILNSFFLIITWILFSIWWHTSSRENCLIEMMIKENSALIAFLMKITHYKYEDDLVIAVRACNLRHNLSNEHKRWK